MAINVKQSRIKVGNTAMFGGPKPKIGTGGNTGPAPKILKKSRFPRIRGSNGKR